MMEVIKTSEIFRNPTPQNMEVIKNIEILRNQPPTPQMMEVIKRIKMRSEGLLSNDFETRRVIFSCCPAANKITLRHWSKITFNFWSGQE